MTAGQASEWYLPDVNAGSYPLDRIDITIPDVQKSFISFDENALKFVADSRIGKAFFTIGITLVN